ncbi:MAG TPA: STAS domain-containing protein [Pseudonocardiaceae bacterium]|jgi:anti-anti-sigma factor
MNFTATLETSGKTAVIVLSGVLNDVSAATFREQVLAAAEHGIARLELDMTNLEELSSAGLRGLAFCREKMPEQVDVVIIGPNDDVRAAIAEVDFQQSVTISN